MLSFPPGAIWFAVAGVAAASVPVILHLINRRRVKVIKWAAMDFLRQSVQRSRRLMKLRDLLLMVLRAAALILFGLALAQPFFTSKSGKLTGHQPLHAVLLIDNSLSMAYEQAGGTLLDEAKRKAKAYIEVLPEGSRISVIPTCGTPAGYRLEAYASKDDAREAIDSIVVVDRAARSSQIARLASEACKSEQSRLTQRLVLFGDQQAENWPAGAADEWKELPELQAVRLGPVVRENAWVADFAPQDAVANVDAPTFFNATVQYEGQQNRPNVEVTLLVDGKQVDSKTMDLVPGQRAPIVFAHTFKNRVEPGRTLEVPVSISLTPDQLPADDVRHYVMPVAAEVPVVFVDELGKQNEKAALGIRGETFQLRTLLAPVTSRSRPEKQLIAVRHLTIDEVTPQKLADARLVVVAGVKEPGRAVDVLRQYVDQGGQLVLAAGGRFDPAAWNRAAWRDGDGILPLPLAPVPVGETRREGAGNVDPLMLNAQQMASRFLPPQMTLSDMQQVFYTSLFFKVVKVIADDETRKKLIEDEAKRLEERLTAAIEVEKGETKKAKAEKTENGENGGLTPPARQVEERPAWLTWQNARRPDQLAQRPRADETVAVLAARLAAEETKLEVAAEFQNGLPWIVERNIGRGHVVFIASGVLGDSTTGWNDVTLGGGTLLYDWLLRQRLAHTLPERNLLARDAQEEFSLPITAADRRKRFTLTRPGGEKTELEPKFLDASTFGLTCGAMMQRGIYAIEAVADAPDSQATAQNEASPAPSASEIASETTASENAQQKADARKSATVERTVLSINGDPREQESDLKQITEDEFKTRFEGSTAVMLGPDQEISLEGSEVSGHWLWKALIVCVILVLLAERFVVAKSASSSPAAKEAVA